MEKSINGFSLALSFITVGFLTLYIKPFNQSFGINISFYFGIVAIAVGVIGLLVEINKLIKKDKGGLDIGVAIFLFIITYITWKILSLVNWLNNFTIVILFFMVLLIFYGFFRGIANVFSYIISNYKEKKELIILTSRIIPLLVTIILLILRYKL